MGTEVALPLHFDNTVTYTDIEAALVGAGFTDYIILRANNGDGSTDVQLSIRDSTPLEAGATLGLISTAISALETVESRSA